jgi:hypothetical protein
MSGRSATVSTVTFDNGSERNDDQSKLRETKEAEGMDAASVVVPMDPRIGVDS